MKFIDENRMGTVVKIGSGKDAVTLRLSPGGKRAILTVPSKEREEVLLAAEEKRKEIGHPRTAGAKCPKIWDHHIALALGAENTPEGFAAWRKDRELPIPAVA